MKVIKPNRLSCLTRPYRYLNKNYFAVTAIVAIDFSSRFCLDSEQDLWRLFNEESVKNFGSEALDFGIPKRTPEIILNAYGFGAYAVNGRTAVSVSVNNVRKDLWVSGDRYWSDGKPSKALPFERIPISWHNAYGGPGFEENPLGKGAQVADLNGMRVRFLPNVEDPARPVTHEGQHQAPAGYSAIPIESPGRNQMLGTYDDHWRVHEFPGFARDIDWEYFNQSPARQRLNRLEAGDEITFVHLHPEKERLTTTVPPLVAKAFIKRAEVVVQGSGGFLEEVPLRLTTYWAYPHLEKAILLYQGAVSIAEDDASDVSHILYAVEHEHFPQAQAYYESVFQKRTSPEIAGLYAMLDKQLVHSDFLRGGEQDEIALSPLIRNKLRKLEKELTQVKLHDGGNPAEKRERMAELEKSTAWLKKIKNGKLARDEVIEDILKQQQEELTLKAVKKQFRQNRQKLKQAPGEMPPEIKERHLRWAESSRAELMASIKKEIEEKHKEGVEQQVGDAARDQLRDLRLKQFDEFAGMADSAGLVAIKRDYSGAQRSLYRIHGLNQLETESLPAGYDGYELYGFVADEMSYAGRSIAGVTVRDGRISGCDFTRARMVCSDFHGTTFTRCDFSSVDWEEAHFYQCQFIDCQLSGVLSNKARFEACRFVGSNLKEWTHFRIAQRDCIFENCRFVNFSYLRSRLERVVFENCDFLRHAFIRGKLANIALKKCRIDSMAFVNIPRLEGLRFDRCDGSKVYVQPETVLENCEILYSTISASGFRGVHFKPVIVTASDLSTCDFSEAGMRGAVIEGSFFKRGLFIRSDLDGARIVNSDFSEAQMKAADVSGAVVRDVSFFSAELAMLKADARTVQQGLLMERSNIYPLRK